MSQVNSVKRSTKKSNWSGAETRCLIGVWGEERIQSKLETHKKVEAYKEIHARLNQEGYDRTYDQVLKKIRDLKYSYRRHQDANNKSGMGRSSWEFYDLIHSFLSDRAATQPKYHVQTMLESDDGEDEDGEDEFGDDADGDACTSSETTSSGTQDGNGNISPDHSDEIQGEQQEKEGQKEGDGEREKDGDEEREKEGDEEREKEGEKKKEERKRKGKGVKTTEKKKKTRVETAMSELTKAMTRIEDTNKKEELDRELEREKRWEKQEMKLLQMQQEHEARMMGQFMSTMARFLTQAQGSHNPTYQPHQPRFSSQGHHNFSTPSTSTPTPFHFPPLLNAELQQHANPHSQSDLYEGPRTSTPINFPTSGSSSQQWSGLPSNLSNAEEDELTYFTL